MKTNAEPSRRSPRIKRVDDLVTGKTNKITKSTGKSKKKKSKKAKPAAKVTVHSDPEPLPVIDRVDDVKVNYLGDLHGLVHNDRVYFQIKHGRKQYLIHYAGYEDIHNEWLPFDVIDNPQLIAEFDSRRNNF